MRRLAWTLGCAAAAVVVAAAATVGAAPRAPLWDVSGRWDSSAEYLVLKQRHDGRVAITVHHTCVPGHIERGAGRLTGDHLTGRVVPAHQPPPAPCARFADIDLRVSPDGRRLVGRFRTDRMAGPISYDARRPARSLVRFRPAIVPRGRRVQVLLRARPALPAGATASVRLCAAADCTTRSGRWGPLFARAAGCRTYRATVVFADARASARRRLCD
jgi:hypothetical protein